MRKRIVIADDDARVLHLLSEYLEGEGYCVTGRALDGLEACELCKTLKPDIALFDLEMPNMDGIEAARNIMKTDPLPIIMLTGSCATDLAARTAEAGIFGCLTKPVDYSELAQMLTIALERFADVERLRKQVDALGHELEARKWIEKAKGIVMQVRSLTEEQAHHYLQMESQRQCRPLSELAKAVVTAEKVSTIEILGNAGARQPTRLAARRT